MEMINVLNTLPEVDYSKGIIFFLVLLGLSFLAILVFSANEGIGGMICSVIAFAVSFIFLVVLGISSHSTTYECTIKPEAKAIEFINTFNITEQRGEIFKVTLKAKPE